MRREYGTVHHNAQSAVQSVFCKVHNSKLTVHSAKHTMHSAQSAQWRKQSAPLGTDQMGSVGFMGHACRGEDYCCHTAWTTQSPLITRCWFCQNRFGIFARLMLAIGGTGLKGGSTLLPLLGPRSHHSKPVSAQNCRHSDCSSSGLVRIDTRDYWVSSWLSGNQSLQCQWWVVWILKRVCATFFVFL